MAQVLSNALIVNGRDIRPVHIKFDIKLIKCFLSLSTSPTLHG